MNEIDELPLREKLEKLLRMTVMGRMDAAIKLADVLAEALEAKAAAPVKAKAKAEKAD